MSGLAWFGLLAFVGGLPAQTQTGAPHFPVMRYIGGWGNPFRVGELAITGATVSFESTWPTRNDKYSIEMPIEDISHVTGHTILKQVTIKLKKGKSYKFIAGDLVKPVIDAISLAMAGNLGPLPPPETTTPPRRNFAPIPAPPPVDAPGASGGIVFGQTPDQVKAILGEPDRLDVDADRRGLSVTKINRIVWYYKSLTVTFVDGKVSVVGQERP